MHAALATTAHVGTLPSGWTCTATGCHAGGTNVAAIHFALGRVDNGCGICHNTTSAPTAACQTAGCHPNGGPVSHASHVSTVTVGTININGTPYTNQACSTCHNTELQAEHAARVAGSGCALCHGGSNPAGSLPAGDYDCSQVGCHAAGSAQPMHPTAALNSAHTVTAPSCTTGVGCHTGGTDIAAIHSTSDVPNKCATCHNATSLATSTCTTSGCHSSGDSTPYAAYSAGSSAVPHPGEVDAHNNYTNGECNNCHDDSNNNCGDCHGDGEYSYLDAPYDIMQSFPGDLPAIHAGVQSTNLSGDWVGGHYTNGCLTCHTPGTTAITDCQTCHDINGMNNDYNWMD
jgi:hypothetical protein